MATLRTTVVVCDICKDAGKPAQKYYMTLPGMDRTGLDLCEDDAAGLEAYRAAIEAVAGHKGRQGRKIYTQGEVEALKQKGPRTAAKKG
jgi:hypothetical protein